MNLIERFIEGDNVDVKPIEKYKEYIDKSTPDIDDFGSVNSSLALNVSAIIYETLNYIICDEQRIIGEFSTYATDSIDFLISEIEDNEQMDFDKIASHKLMKEELELQEGIAGYLETIARVDSGILKP